MKLHNTQGSIVAACSGCSGGKSTFEWQSEGKEFGVIEVMTSEHHGIHSIYNSYRLFKCAGCGQGALGVIKYSGMEGFPGEDNKLMEFYPTPYETVPIPKNTPSGISSEFREAEKCLGNRCFRAASALFRSVLDKVLRANGYKTNRENLYDQIENAASDGVITEARKKRAHDEIRVLGNDVLHEEWKQVTKEDVEAARHYCQRILEDFYDDRESIEAILHKAKRI